ncbi:MAG: ROK family protein [Propionibacteriaceae bacterium]|nr:ROK family protein [Propionibacteriaceae bacterium]
MTQDPALAIAIDVGGTKTAAATVDATGTLVRPKAKRPTPAHAGSEAVLDVIAGSITTQYERLDASRLAGIGIGTAGGVDTTTGRIVSSSDTFTGWLGTDVIAGLRARLPWAADLPIHVQNDVDAHAVGESWRGAGAGAASLLMLAVGTGIGAAHCVDGQVLRGAHSMAGEVGRLRIVPGDGLDLHPEPGPHTFENEAAGPAILHAYRVRGGPGEAARGQHVMKLARAGDPIAAEVVRTLGRRVGRVLSWLVLVLDPEVVVLGGGVPVRGSAWWDALESELRAGLPDAVADLPVKRAQQRNDAALLGAARDAFRLAGVATTDVPEEEPA